MAHQKALSAQAKVRNSFRPFFNSRKLRAFWKEMQTVRHETSPKDYATIFAVVEDNPAYPFPGFGNTFPHDARMVPNQRFRNLKPLELSRELTLQVARLNYHSSKLLPALTSLASINGHLAEQKNAEALAAITAHREAHGLSFVLLKKNLLQSVGHERLPGLAKRSRELTNDYQRTGWALLTYYAYDVMDPTYNPSRGSKVWLDMVRRFMQTAGDWYGRLIEDEVLLQSPSGSHLASAVLRFSALSLLDLALLLWRKHAVHPNHPQLNAAFQQLDEPRTFHVRDYMRSTHFSC